MSTSFTPGKHSLTKNKGYAESISKAVNGSSGSSSSGSSGSSSSNRSNTSSGNSSSKSTGLTPEQQARIKTYSDQFYKAQANNDYKGMQAANDAANQIRNAAGLSAQYATSAIATARNNALNSLKSSSDNSYYDNSYDNQYNNDSMMDTIDDIRDSTVASQKAALKEARNNTLESLKNEKATTASNYYDSKNSLAASADLRAKKLSELMAAKGYGEGSQAQNELASNVAYQGNLGALNRQEQAAYSDIASRGTQADTAYEQGLAQAEANADTTAAQSKLNELGTERNYAREDQQTAKSDYANTVDAYYPDYQAEINNVQKLIDSGQTYDTDGVSLTYKKALLQAKRQEKLNAIAAAEAEAQQQAVTNALNEAKLTGIYNGQPTLDYYKTQYTVNKPYYNPNSGKSSSSSSSSGKVTTAEKNSIIADTISALSGKSQKEQIASLTEGKNWLIKRIGMSGFNQIKSNLGIGTKTSGSLSVEEILSDILGGD